MMLSERSREAGRQNIDFQDYLLEDKQALPRHYYSDRVFKRTWLNKIIIRMNKITIFLFYNLINASLQSRDTLVRRNILKSHRESERRLLGGAEPHDEVEDSQLSFPPRDTLAFGALMLLQTLIATHYMVPLYTLKATSDRYYGITCSKGLNTCQPLVHIVDKPLSLVGGHMHFSSNGPENFELASSCWNHLEAGLRERYGKFYIWNISAGPFSTPILDNYLVVEQNQTLQMFSDEVSLFCNTMGIFLAFCIVVAFLMPGLKRFEIPPLVFLFDPIYSAHYIKSRVRYYVNLIQTSYQNYSLIYCGNQLYRESQLTKSESRSIQGQASYMATKGSLGLWSSVREVNLAPFAEYIPSARSQVWRRMLLISAPMMLFSVSITLMVSFTILCTFFVGANDGTVLLNHELKLFLQSGKMPRALDELVSQHCLMGQQTKEMTVAGATVVNDTALDLARLEMSHFVRLQVIDHLGGVLRELSPDLSLLKFDRSLAPATKALALTTPPSVSHGSQGAARFMLDAEIVIKSIAPTKTLTPLDWSVPVICSLMVGVVMMLYLMIFFAVLSDLCFWLFEIRMKLDICKLLLRHRDEQAWPTPIWLRQYSDSGEEGGSLNGREAANSAPDLASVTHPLAESDDEVSLSLTPSSPSYEFQPTPLNLAHRARERKSSSSAEQPRELRSRRHGRPPASGRASSPISSALADLSLLAKHTGPLFAAYSDGLLEAANQMPGAASMGLAREEQMLSCAETKRLLASVCNIDAWLLIDYIRSGRSRRRRLCEAQARHIIRTDRIIQQRHNLDAFTRQADESFQLSAYLDFRLFFQQIDTARFAINFVLSFTIFHSLNLVASSQYSEYNRSKLGFLIVGYLVSNTSLLGACFFQSQCTKLVGPIYSALASAVNGGLTIKHLSALWNRALLDLTGSRSKFPFGVFSVSISYATVLQFNLGVTSLYILTFDKMH